MKRTKKNILIECHDAGGAEIISAYVKKQKARYRFLCIAHGPAKKIFARKGLSPLVISKSLGLKLLDTEEEINMVVCGTSWISDLGHRIIKKAKKAGIKSAVYLDHWTNYKERFGYPKKNWQNNLPDELWVGDEYAVRLAKRYFKNPVIKLVRNAYFQEIKSNYRALKRAIRAKDDSILVISEPALLTHKTFYESGYVFSETDVLKMVLDYLSEKNVDKNIIIRLHPAEKKGKYQTLLAQYKNKLRFRKQHSGILKDFAGAQLVIGRRSMALALAVLCGKTAVSFIPDKKISFPLPFDKIIKMRNINQLGKLF